MRLSVLRTFSVRFLVLLIKTVFLVFFRFELNFNIIIGKYFIFASFKDTELTTGFVPSTQRGHGGHDEDEDEDEEDLIE